MDPDFKKEEKLAALEALLYMHGEPLSKKRIDVLLGLGPEEVDGLLDAFTEKLASSERGLALVRNEDKVQLVTKPRFHALLESFVKEQLTEDLSPASLETLAIVAYFGPISRVRIDYQRGVNSTFILRSLLLRGLIERFPDPEHPQSILYRASFEFWRHLGMEKPEDLPDYAKFRELLSQFESQNP